MADIPWLVAGLGCRQGCPPAELWQLLTQALAQAGAQAADLKGLATLDRRLNEPGLRALAAALCVPLAGYTATQLAPFEAGLSHRSARSWAYTGCHGVAESAALAHCRALSGLGPRLVVTRLCSATATLSLASAPPT